MPQAGNSFVVKLKKAHLEWGTHRYTYSRPGFIYGEGYIQIPAKYAYSFQIFNQQNLYGANALYSCVSFDGNYNGTLLAQGNQADNNYAKQFSEFGDLKAIGWWYNFINAQVGDFVKIKFTSPSSIIIEHSNNANAFHI